MVGLLRIILIIGSIYLLVKLVTRVILPFIVRKFSEKMNREMQRRVDEMYSHQQYKKEGETTVVNPDAKKKKRRDDDEGDFVEFEEVK